ncbi:MAG: hypothetical protein VCA74_04500 [Deltaproteobacteria bacterium]
MKPASKVLYLLFAPALALLLAATPALALEKAAGCGNPDNDRYCEVGGTLDTSKSCTADPDCTTGTCEDRIVASDALGTLRTAVGLESCDNVRCDVDASGSILAADALLVLKYAVGLITMLDCPGVDLTDIAALPSATGPVADEGSSSSASLMARSEEETSSGMGLSEGGSFFSDKSEDDHLDLSIAACELVNRYRNAVTWASQGDMLTCYITQFISDRESHSCDNCDSIDFYDGNDHIIDLEMMDIVGFCAMDDGTECRSDSDCTSGPCITFDGEGKDNVRLKLRIERAGSETTDTIRSIEMFACEDVAGSTVIVPIKIDESPTFGSLQLDIDYSDIGGFFEGSAGDVECTTALGNSVIFIPNDKDDEKILTLGFISITPVEGASTLVNCNFTSTGDSLSSSDFVITVVDATDGSGAAIRPTASIGTLTGESSGQVQMHYLSQGINGNVFTMRSKGLFSDEYGAGAEAVVVTATLNDDGDFTDKKTIDIATKFTQTGSADGKGGGFSGHSEEMFIQDADSVTVSGVEKGTFAAVDEDGDGKIDSGSDGHEARVYGYSKLIDGNAAAMASQLTAGTIASASEYDYKVSLLAVGIGAAKVSQEGATSFPPCTVATCGFDETCERLELKEDSDSGHCIETWKFAIVEGWNATGALDEEAAIDYVTAVVDGVLPSLSGTDIEFSTSESYDCSGTAEATIAVDMLPVMQACGDMMMEHNPFSCQDVAGGDNYQDCDFAFARCSATEEECSDDDDCEGQCSQSGLDCDSDNDCYTGETCSAQTCNVTAESDLCSFEDPCNGPNPESYCFDDDEVGDFDPCALSDQCSFTGKDCQTDADCGSLCSITKTSCTLAADCGSAETCKTQTCESIKPPFCEASSNSTYGDCCEVRFGDPGCENDDMKNLVCSQDEYCCEVEWDGPCVWLANDEDAGCFDASMDPCAGDNSPFWCADDFGDDDPCASTNTNPPAFCFENSDPCADTSGADLPDFCEGSVNPCNGDNPPAKCMGNLNPCDGDYPPPFCFGAGDNFDPCMSDNPPDFCTDFDSGGPCEGDDPPDWCASEQGDCCMPTFGIPGCTATATQTTVCNLDSYCCDVEWDPPCVQLASFEADASCFPGTGGGATTGGGSGDPCLSTNPPPWCKGFGQDFGTGDFIGNGQAGFGGCCMPHPSPGCEDIATQTTVCAYDPYCCDVEWDPFCVQEANTEGASCYDEEADCNSDYPPPYCFGDASTFDPCEPGPNGEVPNWCSSGEVGDCCMPNSGQGCNSSGQDDNSDGIDDVQACVCEADDYCCGIDMDGDGSIDEGEWDGPCVALADTLCSASCFDGLSIDPCAPGSNGEVPFWCEKDTGWDITADDPCFCPDNDTACQTALPFYCKDDFGDPCQGNDPPDFCGDPCAGNYPPPWCFDNLDEFDPCTDLPNDAKPEYCSATGVVGDCCVPNSGQGCTSSGQDDNSDGIDDVQACVCEKDDFCCQDWGQWDGACVAIATNECAAGCTVGAGDPCASSNPPFWCTTTGLSDGQTGDCCSPTPGIAGCSDKTVVDCVCDMDNYCCDVEWDGACVQGAGFCKADCNFGGGDPCLSDNPPAFCFTVAGDFDDFDPCQDLPSADQPSFCTAGSPSTSPSLNCCDIRDNETGCEIDSVEQCVCSKDDFCCGIDMDDDGSDDEGAWDATCVAMAHTECAAQCFAAGDDPCAADSLGNVPFWCQSPDDWEMENDDPCYCDPADLTCTPASYCNTFGGSTDDEWDEYDGEDHSEEAGEKGNCCEATPHTPECSDATVTSCVCAMDPYCCDNEWDMYCVGEAAQCGTTCGGDGPQHPCESDNPPSWCGWDEFDGTGGGSDNGGDCDGGDDACCICIDSCEGQGGSESYCEEYCSCTDDGDDDACLIQCEDQCEDQGSSEWVCESMCETQCD